MINQKKCLSLLYLFIILLPCTARSSNEITDLDATDHPHTFDASFEEIDFGDLNFSVDDDFLNTPCDQKRNIDPAAIINLLQQANIIPILQEDFFLRTNGLTYRSLLDMPTLGNTECCRVRPHIFGLDIFWNQTDRSYLSKDSDQFSSYLAIQEASLIDKIQKAIDSAAQITGSDAFTFDAQKILCLFAGATVQQRRIGGMFFGTHDWHKTINRALITRFMIPFYYLERNYFLTPEEQDAITNEFGKTSEDEQATLQKNHMISDKICFGDLRIYLETPVLKHKDFNLNLGGQLTIPTAFSVHTGILGRDCSYPTPCFLPTFDLDNLFDILYNVTQNGDNSNVINEAQKEVYNILNKFVLDALDRMSANLLDAKPGNGGHLGLGIFYRSQAPLTFLIKRPGAEKINWISQVSLEYLVPATEKRFFIKKNNPAEFAARDFDNTNEEIAQSNLEFLAQQLVSKLYLVALDTRVQPGVIFHSNNRLCYQGIHWGVNIGTDFWFQSREHLSKINATCASDSTHIAIPYNQLDIEKAQSFHAYQSKLFGGITHQFSRAHDTWFTSLNLESTMITSGIGIDFTGSIKIERHF